MDILGIALFKGDQFIDYIKGEDNYIFMFLNEKFTSDATLTAQLEGEAFASVFHVKSNRSYEINDIHKKPKISLKIKTEAIIPEYSGGALTNELIKKIEKKMEEDIKRKAEKMIVQFQELNIDPLGIGMQVKHRTRNWDQEKWKNLYPTISVQVDANVEIFEAGVIS